jgi:hypothetical protein
VRAAAIEGYVIKGFMDMTKEQIRPQSVTVAGPPRDLLSKLYREIGIAAVAGALEASARKAQKPSQNRKDIPAILRNDEAA